MYLKSKSLNLFKVNYSSSPIKSLFDGIDLFITTLLGWTKLLYFFNQVLRKYNLKIKIKIDKNRSQKFAK